MSGDDVGKPWVGNSGVVVYARGENFGSMPFTSVFRPSSLFGITMTSKRARRPPARASSSMISV